jgi:hypothetical protein
MSEHTDTSTTATLRRGKRRDEARDLLKALRVENPEADRDALVKLYLAHVRPIVDRADDPDAVETLVFNPLREWVGAQIVEPRQRTKSREQRASERAVELSQIAARDEKRVEEIVARRLLEYEMMDGRTIGDLTGADCRKLAEREGAFFHAIAEHIPARARVRNHYSELELQALARHHKLIVP